MTTHGNSVLTLERVLAIHGDCAWREGDHAERTVWMNPIAAKKGTLLHWDRIERHRMEICTMLQELPLAFMEPYSGDAFANAMRDRHGREWTDSIESVDMLVRLGLAVGKVPFVSPRITWPDLAGGLPWFGVATVEHPASSWIAMLRSWRSELLHIPGAAKVPDLFRPYEDPDMHGRGQFPSN